MSEKQIKFTFVILHYNVINDTIECVDSIKKHMKGVDYRIVIVDNKSPNGTGAELCNKYSSDPTVKVLCNDKNEGFARGNNLGFKYAKYELDSQFIVLLNNDTLLLNDDFAQKVIEEYELSKFAVLGPAILTPSNYNNSNPRAFKEHSIRYYRYLMLKSMAYVATYSIGLGSVIDRLKRAKNAGKIASVKDPYPRRVENAMLHGSFWVFSPEYIEKFDGLDDRTFLYMEEELLYYRLKKHGLKSVYTPQIRIFHKEDAATDSLKRSPVKKVIFKERECIKSTAILLKELKKR